MIRHPQDNEGLLRTLLAGGVDFAIVGGVAAVLHGATRMTVDLDILAPFTESNLQRLLDALAPHDPRHATRPDLSLLDETAARLLGFRMLGHTVKVISRDHLIAVKRALPRPRDRRDAVELEAAKRRDESV